MYLNIQDGNTSMQYTLTESYTKPYIKVNNESVLPLITDTSQGLQLKVQINNQTYRGAVYSSTSESASYLTSSSNKGDMSNTTALTSVKTTSVETLTSVATTSTAVTTATRTSKSTPMTKVVTTSTAVTTATRTSKSTPMTKVVTTSTAVTTATRTSKSTPMTRTTTSSFTDRYFKGIISYGPASRQFTETYEASFTRDQAPVSHSTSSLMQHSILLGSTAYMTRSNTVNRTSSKYSWTRLLSNLPNSITNKVVGGISYTLSTSLNSNGYLMTGITSGGGTSYYSGCYTLRSTSSNGVPYPTTYGVTETTSTSYTTSKYTSSTKPLTAVSTTSTSYTTSKYTSSTKPLTAISTTSTSYTTSKYTSKTAPLTKTVTYDVSYHTAVDTYGYTGVSSSSSSVETWN